MQSMMKRLPLALMSSFLLIAKASEAAPLVDKVIGYNPDSTRLDTYILGDDADPDVYYIPYSQLSIAPTPKDPKVPDFSFTYLPDGLVIQVGLKASIDKTALKPYVDEIKAGNPNAKFRTLPIDWGHYIPTIQPNSSYSVNPGERTDYVIAHNQPSQVKNLVFFFTPREADFIVTSLVSGGIFAINYEYAYKGMVTPSKITIHMDWSTINSSLSTHAHSRVLSNTGFKKAMNDLVSQSAITVEKVGGGSADIISQIFVEKTIRDRCFQVIYQSLGDAAGYKYNPTGCAAGQDTYEFISNQAAQMIGTTGFQFWSLCDKFPQNFSYRDPSGVMVHGCPKSVYNSSGVMGEGQPTPPINTELPDPNLDLLR